MATTRLRHGTNFVITLVSLLVILIVINVFSYLKLDLVRWDLTENKDYTITPATRKILGELENLVTVKVYLSTDLPAILLTFERQLRDLLKEYETYGRGKLDVEYITPKNDPATQQDLMMQGIRAQPVGVFKKDSSTQKLVFNSIAIEYEEKREVIASLLEQVGGGRGLGLISDFEYLMTSKIFKVQRSRREAVGWFTNAPDLDLKKNYSMLRQIVDKEWDAQEVRLDPPRKIPPNVSVLAVISPRNLSDVQLYEIDQYLMRGGKMLALVDGFKQQTRGRGIEAFVSEPTNFTALLEKYGLKVNDALAVEPRYRALAPMGGFIAMPYPFWVNVMARGFNKKNPSVSRLRLMTLLWTKTFDAASSMPAGVRMIPLAQTSSVAFARPGPRVNPDPNARVPQAKRGVQTVVAALEGTLPSYFPKGTPIPLDEGTTVPSPARTSEKERKFQSDGSQIVVVGNTDFLRNIYLQALYRTGQRSNADSNAAFFLNTLEWLALGKGLGEIRARQVVSRPIKNVVPEVKDAKSEISEGQRTAYKILGTFMMPVVVVVAGVFYNTIRRRRRRSVADRILGN